jgi:predicted nucleotidyltransferase
MEFLENHRITERRQALNNLINGSATSGWEKLLALFFPAVIIRKRAERFVQLFHHLTIRPASQKWNVLVRPYEGNNPTALALRHVIQTQTEREVADAILFGSLADSTACPYSDFDCLIVLDDQLLNAADRLQQLAHKLFQWRKLLLRTDILQHHGWFVVLQSDRLCWEQSFLPVTTLEESRSLLHDQPYELEFFTPAYEDFHTPFLQLCHLLLKTTSSAVQWMNLYELKTWMSRFFHTPALFCQALYQKGIGKKDSFDLAKSYFSDARWKPVAVLSRCRLEWQQHIPSVNQWLIERSFNWPFFIRRYFYPPASPALKQRVAALMPSIHDLLQAMIEKVEAQQTAEA